ncbi:MAG: nucleotidyl transferase AbiEii/AbiGii toxin family protein [Burkholderiales bacterium]
MAVTSLNLTGKIDPLVAELLAVAARVAEREGVEFFVAGAAARDLVLEHGYGMKSRRATLDVDLACSLPDWGAYARFHAVLAGTGAFVPVSGIAHRLSYRGGALTVDIVPFGGLEKPPGEIAWPPDFATRMGVTGFTDVHDHCILVTVAPGVVVKVVSLPGFAILKLIAWSERKNQTTRDGADIGFLCRHYGPGCAYSRLTGEEYGVLGLEGYDVDRAGVRLLGRDMVAIMRPGTRARVLSVLAAELADSSGFRLALAIAGDARDEEDFNRALETLRVLKAGIEDAPGRR